MAVKEGVVKRGFRNVLIGFILGVAATVGGIVYWVDPLNDSPAAGGASVPATVERLEGKLEALQLRAEDIREELGETGRIVRRKASEWRATVAEELSDVRITAMVESQLASDPDLSAWDIDVSTTDGGVNLSGRVTSPDLVGRAVLAALETEGVRSVVSSLRVDPRG